MKKNIYSLMGIALVAILLTACSDQFLQDKKNYEKVTSNVFDDYEGAKLRVNAIYGECLPNPSSVAAWNNNCTGIYSDIQSKATEEYYGNGDDVSFVNSSKELSSSVGNIVPDYFQNEIKYLSNVWGRIRGINDAIEGFNQCALSEEQKNEMLGQCYFFRAWCYYQLVKWYGGVPIIKERQDAEVSSFTQRSSAKECFDFIISDLNTAADLLQQATGNGGWGGDDWGRVTTGTALALKGRVLVLWASPMFNRKNDQTRWTTAYTEMENDLPRIKACGYDLYSEEGDNAKGFAHMFAMRQSSEAVFVVLHNTIDGSKDNGYNNQWERFIRPINTQLRAGSGQEPSSMLVDLFPMADGRVPADATTYTKLKAANPTAYISPDPTNAEYYKDYPFMNRDPRFYRTFAFPGVRWAYNGDASQGGTNKNPDDGPNYELWNYVWYANSTDMTDPEKGTCYGADNLLNSARGMYVRKRTDDLDVNSPMYDYQSGANNGAFTYSGAPYMEIRFAEVLLNLAEAACGAGEMAKAASYLQLVRDRVGVPAYSDLSDQATCMSAILYERQVELAYEGKRFDDMRRWMLFDGGTDASLAEVPGGAPATWKLEGWGGNTCTWLGVTPLNSQFREKRQFRLNDDYYAYWNADKATSYEGDPLLLAQAAKEADPSLPIDPYRCAPLDLRNAVSAQQDVLQQWYASHLKRVDKSGDSYKNHVKIPIKFFSKYYFLGLAVGAQNRNDSRLLQTIGWDDKNTGGYGTFDPLAE